MRRGARRQHAADARRVPAGRRRYLSWARLLLAPRNGLLPALGARLAAHPLLAAWALAIARHLPGPLSASVSRRLIERMAVRIEVPTAGGSRMRVDSRDGFGRVLAATGVWHPPVTATFVNVLSAGDVCVDVGAHLGYFTLLAARLVGPDGHVYALEPSPRTYSELIGNLDLNDVSNVTALRVAGGDRAGEAVLDDHPGGHSLRSAVVADAAATASATRVPVRQVASVVRPSDARRVRLVKIDVEGYEVEVLRGLEPLLEERVRPAIVVELHPARSGEAGELVDELCVRFALDAAQLVELESWTATTPWIHDPPLAAADRTQNIVLSPRPWRRRRARRRVATPGLERRIETRGSVRARGLRRTGATAVSLAAIAFLLFGVLPEALGDRPYNPFGSDTRAHAHHETH
jgi:FkbM family methyltransferase